MQLTQLQDSNTLLTYSLMTTPAPVQVSPAQNDPSYAALTFVASNNTSGDVYVSKIVIQLPVGNPQQPDSTDLTEQSTGLRPSISPSADWNAPSSPAPGVFVFTPAGGQPLRVDSQGYAITVANIQVSTAVGTATVTIHETSSTSQTGPQQPSQCTVSVPKFPYGFYVGNFAAQKPLVQNGQGAVLSWVGSENATYTMLWNTQTQNVSSVRQWTSPPLTDTTTFILQVQAQELGQTVTLYFSVTVIVANPNITATLLDVLQTSTLQGTVTIGNGGAPANLSVNGALSATGNIGTSGALNAEGVSTLANLSVPGNLQSGSLATGGLTVNGAATLASLLVNGGLSVGGAVGMMLAAQPIGIGSYAAKTDGFVVGHVGDGGSDPSKKSWARIAAGNTSSSVEAIGGNTVTWLNNKADWVASPSPNSLILPVRKGDNWWVSQQLWNGNEVNPPIWFYWVPLGISSMAESYQKISDKPARDIMKSSLPQAGGFTRTPEKEVEVLVAVLDQAFKGTLTKTQKSRLQKAIASLVCAPAAGQPALPRRLRKP